MVNRGFWREKRVFITGHTGFKGAWLSLWLSQMGADVIGYSLAPPTSPSLYELPGIKELIIDVREDLRHVDKATCQDGLLFETARRGIK